MSRRRSVFLLACAVSCAYLNSFWGVFQFDDYNVIVDNAVVHSWAAWRADLRGGIRPVLKLSYLLNWLTGPGPFGFHLFNLLVHSANVILLYFLSLELTERFQERLSFPASDRAAFFASLLFALHPVQTEAVTYISGRSTSLMAMFYLGSILAYARGGGKDRPVLRSVVSPLLFLLAVMTKEIAVTLPFAILLREKVCCPEKNLKTALKEQAVHWGLLGAIFILLLAHSGYRRLLEFGFETRGVKENIYSQLNGVAYLVSRFFLPGRLNIDPDLPVISSWSAGLAAEAVFFLSLVLLALLSLRKRPWLCFGIGWFLLHLAPTNSVVPRLDIANERQLYLASFGIFLALAAECAIHFDVSGRLRRFPGTPAVSLAVILVVALGYFTVMRNQTYRSEVALWEDVRMKSPKKARAFNNLGYAYALAGRDEEAKRAYLAALALKPDYSLARNNLSAVEARQAENCAGERPQRGD